MRLKIVALASFTAMFVVANAQTMSWEVPRATVRAVLQQWAQANGYGVVWSDGIPDFPTREAQVNGNFATASAALVSGSAYGQLNLYCPPAVSFPATAYTPTVRVDATAQLVFVYGSPTTQECRPR